jgi:hypothetical protein
MEELRPGQKTAERHYDNSGNHVTRKSPFLRWRRRGQQPSRNLRHGPPAFRIQPNTLTRDLEEGGRKGFWNGRIVLTNRLTGRWPLRQRFHQGDAKGPNIASW